jgi:hypothetical protein
MYWHLGLGLPRAENYEQLFKSKKKKKEKEKEKKIHRKISNK